MLLFDQLLMIPFFSGLPSENVTDFVEDFNQIAVYYKWSEEEKYIALKQKLAGEPLALIRQNRSEKSNMDYLQELLIEQYSPKRNFVSELHKFMAYSQSPTTSVNRFINQAVQMSKQLFLTGELDRDLEEGMRKHMLKAMLLENLHPEIKRGVIIANPSTVDEIRTVALLHEKAWKSCLSNCNPFLRLSQVTVTADKTANRCEEVTGDRELRQIKIEEDLRFLHFKLDQAFLKRDTQSCPLGEKIQTYKKTAKIVVPRNLVNYLLQMHHDSSMGSHPGIKKTIRRIKLSFYWEGMVNDIKNYVKTCVSCCHKLQMHKNRHKGVSDKQRKLESIFKVDYGCLSNCTDQIVHFDPLTHFHTSENNISGVKKACSKTNIYLPLQTLDTLENKKRLAHFSVDHDEPPCISWLQTVARNKNNKSKLFFPNYQSYLTPPEKVARGKEPHYQDSKGISMHRMPQQTSPFSRAGSRDQRVMNFGGLSETCGG